MADSWTDTHPIPYRFSDLASPEQNLREIVDTISQPSFRPISQKYRPWRKVHRIARAMGIDPKLAWLGVKFERFRLYRLLDLDAADGPAFGFSQTPALHQSLHQIDQVAGTGPQGSTLFDRDRGILGSDDARRRFLIKTLMDEAIDSSRIEGAVTTRKDARRLLRSGKEPSNNYERMVVNNYRAMDHLKSWIDEDLTPARIIDLQRVLTEGTLDDAGQSGRYRRADEDVRVVDARTNETVYVPPHADLLVERVQRVCDFANRDHDGNGFIHPIVKACVLHFLIGYEHPFVDGNGRTARALFYWSAIRAGYRVLEYTVISELILKGFAKYPRAFLDVETDENDLTYFILYKVRIIERALASLEDRLVEEHRRLTRSLKLARTDPSLNLRQRLVLEHVLRNPGANYTVKSHANTSRITPTTARTDLEDLVSRGYMSSFKDGRQVVYVPAPDLEAQLGDEAL